MNKHLNKVFSAVTILALMLMALPLQTAHAATSITQWNFESPNTPADVTDAATYPNSIAPVLGSGNAGGFHASAATDWSSPAGNGSVDSFSSNNWAVGDYYQFTVNTLNFTGIQLSWDQNSSGTGPRDFKLTYSTDGTTFTDFDSYIVLASTWSSGTPVPASNITRDLSAITALDNQANVYFRLINTSTTSANLGTVGTGGTNRVDNFTVSGTPIVVEVAPSVTGTTPANGATNVAVNANIDVTFSEAVNAIGSSFGISCGTSGAHSYALSGGSTTFTLDPDTDFANNESCTVTVVAAQVTDQDANDPPNEMAADYIFSFTTVSAVDDAPSVSSTTPTNGATNIAVNANIDVTFSEAVSASGSSFGISCTTSGVHSYAVSGGSTTFVLNPDTDFANSESCTVTVVAAQVTDQDANDPPDNMSADYIFSFDTVSAAPAAPLVINEIDYDQPGTDGAEFVEIRNNSGVSVDLSSYNIQMINGNGGAQYLLFTLPAVNLAPGDYFVLCSNAGSTPNCDLDVAPNTDLIQNGAPDAVALRSGTTIIDTVSYEGNTVAPYTEGTGTSASDNNTDANLGLSRLPDGTDTNQNNNDFSLRCVTPGEANTTGTSGCILDLLPNVATTNPSNSATNVSISNNIEINFSEAVTVSGNWFSISCSNSGAHTAVVGGVSPNFTLDPDIDFGFSELCAVTVFAAQVTDQDSILENMATDFTFSFTTAAQPFGVCGGPATFIHDIQGTGLQSPLNLTTGVIIEAIVVGDYQGTSQLSGFHLQEQDADADANSLTSEGLFVFNTSFPVNSGDLVRLRGTVNEFSTSGVFLTEIVSLTDLTVCSTGNTVTPTSIDLPVSNLNDWEAYEGMLVAISETLTVTETFTLARFGEVGLSANGRLFNPTMITSPGPLAIAQQDINDRSRILLDDGNGQQNIDPTIHPIGGLSAANTLRSGYTVNGVSGVLEQRFGVYRIQPVGPVTFNATNPRPVSPEPVDGRLKVAALNVLNFFTTLDTGSPICGPSGGLDCRGANSTFEFDRQRDKILSEMLGLNADVFGLMELENNASASLQSLVDGLNAATAPGMFDFINTGTIGTDAIKVGLIYRTTTVTPVGAHAILDSNVDPAFIDTLNRPVLAQTFEENLTGERFTVAVNHLKSKGSACALDPDTHDGQGNCNLTRRNAAIAEASWLATDPTGSGDPDFVLIGDFNAYAKEDPITALLNAGYTDLIDLHAVSTPYSYVFDGQSGYLDHGLGTGTFTGQVAGATEWHINADEPIALDYNEEFKTPGPLGQVTTFYAPDAYRSSDHDPLLIGLNLLPQCNGQNATVYVDHTNKIVGGPLNGQTYLGLLTGTNANDVIVGTDSSDTVFVLNGNDVVCSLGGSDTILGGAGHDTINSGSGNDTVFGNANNDVIDTGEGNDTAFGESGNDTINGGNGKDSIFGGDGLDVLDGGADKDVVDGGSGTDTLTGGSGDDIVRGGLGNDALDGGADSDACNGGPGTDTSSSCEINILIP